MNRTTLSRALVVTAACALGGCAVPVTATSAINGGDPAAVSAALGRAKASTGPTNDLHRPMAFAVVAPTAGSGGLELWAYDIDGKAVRWRAHADIVGRVAVAGPSVVASERSGALVAHDVSTGTVRWQKKLDSAFARIGYAAGGDIVAEVVQEAGGSSGRARAASVIAYDAASGSRRWTTDVGGPVGAPVVWKGLVAVPRQSQWVTLIDQASGKILAEILSREEAATFVRGLPEGLFFGSKGVFRASAESAIARRDSPAYTQAKLPEFVRPLYEHDQYVPAEVGYSAIDRNRLLWRGSPIAGPLAFADHAVVVHNFRFFFSLDAGTAALRWAYNQPRVDAVSSEDTGRAILFITADGVVKGLDLGSGQVGYEASLGQPGTVAVVGAAFDADGFGVEAPAAGDSLAKQLSSIVFDPDKRFSDVRMFALDELTKLSGPDVTRELLKSLDAGEVIPTPVMRRAMDVLVARKDRSLLPLYLEGIKVHPDYVEDREPKHIDFYARAVGALKAKEAIAPLLEHLRLPDTDLDAIHDIAEAALATESKEALEPFQDFLVQYRADPALAAHPAPLLSACDVLAKLGGPKERALLLFVAEEPQTVEALSSYVHKALEPESTVVKPAE